MRMGVVLMFGVFVTLGTWGYLEAFASSGSVSGAPHTLLLPVTWADSQRANPDGQWTTPVVLALGAQQTEAMPDRLPTDVAVVASSGGPEAHRPSRTAVPLPIRSPRGRTVIAMAAAPLPERSPGMTRVMSAQLLPVRRPDDLLPMARVAQAVREAISQSSARAKIEREVITASIPRPAEIVAQAIVDRVVVREVLVAVQAEPRPRPDFREMSALGGPRP